MKAPDKVVKFWLFFGVFCWKRGKKNSFQEGKKVLATLELGKLMTQMLASCLEYGTLYERIKAKGVWGRGKVLLIICSQKHALLLRMFLRHHQPAYFFHC